MELKYFHAVDDFYRGAEGFLLAHEAEHNLLLGICAGLMRHPERVETASYLATIDGDGVVVAVALRTPPQNLVLSRMDAPEALPLIIADVSRQSPTLPGVLGPAEVSLRFAQAWATASGQDYRQGLAERIYQLDAVRPVRGAPGALRRATPDDRDLVIDWLLAFAREALGEDHPRVAAERVAEARCAGGADGGLYLWDDGHPVSLAGYSGPTPHGIRIAPVYTPPEERGKGYASACVAGLSQLLLDGGRTYCFLFTDLSNPTSNHIYQAIGYRPVCDVDEYKFL